MKKITAIISGIILIFSLYGCWDRVESRSLALINSILYDLNDEEGYEVTVEIRNPAAAGGEGGGSDMAPSITVSEKGPTISETVSRMAVHLERRIFGGQNRARIFSEKFAKKGMEGALDFFSRDRIADEKPLVVVVRHQDPKIIFKAKKGLADVLGDYVANLMENQGRTFGQATFVNTLTFLQDLLSDGKQPVAGLLDVVPIEDKKEAKSAGAGDQGSNGGEEENPEETLRLEYKGLAAFKDGKLVGYFNGEEATAYNFITNNMKTAYISIDADGCKITAFIDKANTDIKALPDGDGIKFEVVMDIKLALSQVDGNLDVLDKETEDYIHQIFNEKIKEKLEKAIVKAQTEFNSDIFGFGSHIHRQHPQKWKTMKENWGDMFGSTEIDVKVTTEIKVSGEFKQPVKGVEEDA